MRFDDEFSVDKNVEGDGCSSFHVSSSDCRDCGIHVNKDNRLNCLGFETGDSLKLFCNKLAGMSSAGCILQRLSYVDANPVHRVYRNKALATECWPTY